MPRAPRRHPAQDVETATTTPTRPTATNAITAAIPPFMLETPPHAPFLTTPIPPSTNPGNSIVPDANAPHRRHARSQRPTPTTSGHPPAENSQVSSNALGSSVSEAGHEDEQSFLDSVHHEAEEAKQLQGLRDISSLATWTLSSAKPGCSLAQLRHPSPAHFWQSDGPQPHTLTLHFFKMVAIIKMRIYLDFDLDESYTPTKMKFLAGMSEGGLVEFGLWEVTETTDPETGEIHSSIEGIRGWIDVPLKGVGGRETRDRENVEFEQMELCVNNGEGVPAQRAARQSSFGLSSSGAIGTDDSGGLEEGVGGDVLKAMVVQVRICENHQNGKDTHVRGFQVFSRDETIVMDARKRVKKSRNGQAEEDDTVEEVVGLKPADWMGDPEIRRNSEETMLQKMLCIFKHRPDSGLSSAGTTPTSRGPLLRSNFPSNPSAVLTRATLDTTAMPFHQFRLRLRYQHVFKIAPALLATIIFSALAFKNAVSDKQYHHHCRSLLQRGRWSHNFESRHPHMIWNPSGCMLRSFEPKEAASCLEAANATFVGDSSARQIFWGLAKRLDQQRAVNSIDLASKHANLVFEEKNASINFIWDPFLNSTSTSTLNYSSSQLFVIGGGLWHLQHFHDNFLPRYIESVARITTDSRPWDTAAGAHFSTFSNSESIIFLPVLLPEEQKFSLEGASTLTTDRVFALNQQLKNLSFQKSFDILWPLLTMTRGNPSTDEASSIYVNEVVSLTLADILLNRMCNRNPLPKVTQASYYCCSGPQVLPAIQICLLVAAFGVIFLQGLHAIYICFWVRYATVSHKNTTIARTWAVAVFVGAALACYAADRTLLFEKSMKVTDERLFSGLLASFLLLASFSVGRCTPAQSTIQLNDGVATYQILPRAQTEEWKGWMQLVILLYHYFGMSQVIWVYRLVRLLVASYLFLTGFGHATYFLSTNDFSFYRVMAILIRINILSCILPFVMGTHYGFYYFSAVSSIWFLITWATIQPDSIRHVVDVRRSCIRILVSLITLQAILRARTVLLIMFDFFRVIGMLSIDHHEFVFRLGLDSYVPFAGMLLAVLYAKHREMLERYEYNPFNRILTSTMAVAVLTMYFIFSSQFKDKSQFNNWHTLTSPWPILAYVTLRNATPTLRSHHSRAFAWLGRCSLETFILQYHIWLAADSKGLLHLGLFDTFSMNDQSTIGNISFWLESFIISALFIWISWALSGATSTITAWITGTKMGAAVSVSSPRISLSVKVALIMLTLWIFNIMWQVSAQNFVTAAM